MSSRRCIVWPLLVLPLVVVVGCTSNKERSNTPMDIETAAETLRNVITDTQRLLAPLRFSVFGAIPAETSGPCDLPHGGEGQSVLFPVYASDSVSDPNEIATKVAEHWRARGYEVRITTRRTLTDLTIAPPGGGVILFGVGAPGTPASITGESACVPKRDDK